MKIVHITETYAPAGGIGQYVIDISTLLQRHGHDNTIIYLQDHPSTIKNDTIPSYLIPDTKEGGMEINQFMNREKPSVAFLHAVYNPALVQEIAQLVPTISYIHGFYPVCPGLAKYFRRGDQVCTQRFGLGCAPMIYLRRCASARHPRSVYHIMKTTYAHKAACQHVKRVLVASTYMHNLLVQNGFKAERIDILAPHFEEPPLPKISQKPSSTILYAGRLEIEKGFPYLLKALQQIHTPCKLLVAGEGTHQVEYQTMAHQLGLDNKIAFLGWLDQSTLRLIYKEAILLAMPSICPEAFGKAGIEAMAYGIPVVAFDVGGISDWLQDGWNGFLVPPRDSARLAARIETVLNDPHLASELGAKGQKIVEQRYSPQQHLDQLLRIFEMAAKSKTCL